MVNRKIGDISMRLVGVVDCQVADIERYMVYVGIGAWPVSASRGGADDDGVCQRFSGLTSLFIKPKRI